MAYQGKKAFLDRCPRCLEYRTKGTVAGQRDVLGRIGCEYCRHGTLVEVGLALRAFFGVCYGTAAD